MQEEEGRRASCEAFAVPRVEASKASEFCVRLLKVAVVVRTVELSLLRAALLRAALLCAALRAAL